MFTKLFDQIRYLIYFIKNCLCIQNLFKIYLILIIIIYNHNLMTNIYSTKFHLMIQSSRIQIQRTFKLSFYIFTKIYFYSKLKILILCEIYKQQMIIKQKIIWWTKCQSLKPQESKGITKQEDRWKLMQEGRMNMVSGMLRNCSV